MYLLEACKEPLSGNCLPRIGPFSEQADHHNHLQKRKWTPIALTLVGKQFKGGSCMNVQLVMHLFTRKGRPVAEIGFSGDSQFVAEAILI